MRLSFFLVKKLNHNLPQCLHRRGNPSPQAAWAGGAVSQPRPPPDYNSFEATPASTQKERTGPRAHTARIRHVFRARTRRAQPARLPARRTARLPARRATRLTVRRTACSRRAERRSRRAEPRVFRRADGTPLRRAKCLTSEPVLLDSGLVAVCSSRLGDVCAQSQVISRN